MSAAAPAGGSNPSKWLAITPEGKADGKEDAKDNKVQNVFAHAAETRQTDIQVAAAGAGAAVDLSFNNTKLISEIQRQILTHTVFIYFGEEVTAGTLFTLEQSKCLWLVIYRHMIKTDEQHILRKFGDDEDFIRAFDVQSRKNILAVFPHLEGQKFDFLMLSTWLKPNGTQVVDFPGVIDPATHQEFTRLSQGERPRKSPQEQADKAALWLVIKKKLNLSQKKPQVPSGAAAASAAGESQAPSQKVDGINNLFPLYDLINIHLDDLTAPAGEEAKQFHAEKEKHLTFIANFLVAIPFNEPPIAWMPRILKALAEFQNPFVDKIKTAIFLHASHSQWVIGLPTQDPRSTYQFINPDPNIAKGSVVRAIFYHFSAQLLLQISKLSPDEINAIDWDNFEKVIAALNATLKITNAPLQAVLPLFKSQKLPQDLRLLAENALSMVLKPYLKAK